MTPLIAIVMGMLILVVILAVVFRAG